MNRLFLSKSEFIHAYDCDTKLWYMKRGYPRTEDADGAMRHFARSGYVVGTMATLLFPEGTEITGSTEQALAATRQLMHKEHVTLFEAAFLCDGFLVRVDILEKKGNVIRIIEVKSFSKSAREGAKTIDVKYMRDIAFQAMVVKKAFPRADVQCTGCCVNKDKENAVPDMARWFRVGETVSQAKADADPMTGQESVLPRRRSWTHVRVEFTGDLEQLQREHLLRFIDVNARVGSMMSDVEARAQELLAVVRSDVKPASTRALRCKDCSYRVAADISPSGFDECWGDDARRATILDVVQIGNLNRPTLGNGGVSAIDVMIAEGNVTKEDLAASGIVSESAYDGAVYIDVHGLPEQADDGFAEALTALRYPLHFVDFETSAAVIPPVAGMRPYESVAFQWSCHTLREPTSEPEHAEWIDLDHDFPSQDFARALLDHLRTYGGVGTVLTWSPYEKRTLLNIRDHLHRGLGSGNADMVANELDALIKSTSADAGVRIVDMEHLLKQYRYVHPGAGGKSSIKTILPAILSTTRSNRIAGWLQSLQLYRPTSSGIADPYTLLVNDGDVGGGSAALHAYASAVHGGLTPEERNALRRSLLRYCTVDTLAMVIVWEHWLNRFPLPAGPAA